MTDAYVVGAVRSPVGRRGGGLSTVHPADLGAAVLRALVERTGVDPAEIDDVLWGCVGQMGPQASNIGRTTVLSAGLPEAVPAGSIGRQCGSAPPCPSPGTAARRSTRSRSPRSRSWPAGPASSWPVAPR